MSHNEAKCYRDITRLRWHIADVTALLAELSDHGISTTKTEAVRRSLVANKGALTRMGD